MIVLVRIVLVAGNFVGAANQITDLLWAKDSYTWDVKVGCSCIERKDDIENSWFAMLIPTSYLL